MADVSAPSELEELPQTEVLPGTAEVA